MRTWALLSCVLVVVFIVDGVQGLLFLPVSGDHCSDNIDCTSGCCLMTGRRHRRPTGVCQPIRDMGKYCAPGNRLRNYFGSRVYTSSCPCRAGLTCKPKWSTVMHGRSVMEDPKCMPESLHPYLLAVRGALHRTNSLDLVPAE